MKIKHFFLILLALAVIQLSGAQNAVAVGGDDPASATPMSAQQSADFSDGKKFIEQENWPEAIVSFSKVIQESTKNADALNYLGYAHRQQGDFERAFDIYQRALAINPEHKGAHEYVGEAYLQTNNLPKAQEHLKKLDNLCFFGCAEYTMLKRAIADYKKKQGS